VFFFEGVGDGNTRLNQSGAPAERTLWRLGPAHRQALLVMVATLALIKVETTAVGGKAGVLDEFFGLFDGREAVVLEHVFFDDDAVDVVGAGVQAEFAERESHAEERDFNVRDVVEVEAAEREEF